ncbi:discoidin domain-containing protein [Catenulispora pinisilvae]|uniref:discoidin domain-containing protein n=1 Tax=Catenulispora pinisilvae TaxID=2705253 RepID=UPI0018917F6F|nr:discoidin domain-containing protein [Catenulispora pinisilvae]
MYDRRRPLRRRPQLIVALIIALLASVLGFNAATGTKARAASCDTTTNLALNKTATASSVESDAFPASAAVDGNTGTRWSSQFSDPQWLQVDLGSTQSICQVVLTWETASAKAYEIQTSPDGTTWTSIYSTTTGPGGTETLNVTGSGRYIRMYGTARNTAYGYSLFEFAAYGPPGSSNGSCADNAALNRPATASSEENADFPASAAVDGNTGTRWSSQFSDPQWLQVDLGTSQAICGVTLNWEAAYGKAYQIQTSDDGTTWTTVYSTTTGAGGVENLTVSGTGRYVRMYGTQRATAYGYSLWEFAVLTAASTTDPFWGDPSTIPPAQNVMMVKILNRTNGKYPDSQVYWSFDGQTHSIADQPYLDMPVNSSGRMYFYLGSPTSPYYDFIEFTVGPNQFNGNTTRVDAFGLKLAMRLHTHDGYDVQVGETQSVFAEDRSVTFQRFINSVPPEFKVLAQTQAPYRIIAPGSDPSFQAGGANANYFTAYAASAGVNETTQNIFGCAGSMASNPTMCAALNRHVATLPAAQQQDPSQYYQAAPANYYAQFWHENAINGLAYGFPYDDVDGQSSYISHANPQWLEIAVGW